MPTKPFEPLLYRELAKASAKEAIEIASPLLLELVNYATNAFQRCQTSSSGEPDEDLPVLALYLHIIEMTDGIEVLIAQSCPIPAIPPLRSSFEAQLGIDYILEEEYKQRSFAWMVGYVHQRLEGYETLDPSTQRGSDFATNLLDDIVGRRFEVPSFPKLPQAINNLKNLLNKPNYRRAEEEYQKRKRRPNWYSLYGGPRNLRELAKHVHRGAEYDILYRYWSDVTHAGDLSRYITRTSKGAPAFEPLRNSKELRQVSSFAATLMLRATRKVLGKFRPGEEDSIKRWYIREIRDRFLWLFKEDNSKPS